MKVNWLEISLLRNQKALHRRLRKRVSFILPDLLKYNISGLDSYSKLPMTTKMIGWKGQTYCRVLSYVRFL